MQYAFTQVLVEHVNTSDKPILLIGDTVRYDMICTVMLDIISLITALNLDVLAIYIQLNFLKRRAIKHQSL